ncbi:hypothetical protein [Fusobacterium mortiferum]|uniref:hypothetical protein n=1 Tax=Fusobacterium mortiferum TaxID=850 RepID=UPI00195E0DA6|nr:hypothetical protein [Fusobacterium mortiferum]
MNIIKKEIINWARQITSNTDLITFEDFILELYKDSRVGLQVEDLIEIGVTPWKDKKIEEMTKEELFILLNSIKSCIYEKNIYEKIEYIFNSAYKKYERLSTDKNCFPMILVFSYGIMLGKAWERRGIRKY